MNAIAAIFLLAGHPLAQDAEKPALTDVEAGALGAFAADQVDAAGAPEELKRSLLAKIEELRKARGAAPEASPATPGRKKKRAARKQAASPAASIKNGLTDGDRQALGKAVLAEINAGREGKELADAVQKELARLRAERVKASSTPAPARKKKKKTPGA